MPSPQVLADYYGSYYRSEGAKIAIGDAEVFIKNLLRGIRLNKSNTTLRILDFGGGDGTLGLTIAQRLLADGDHQIEFTLVDFQAPSTHVTDERLTVTHCQELESANGQFDLVLASAVLEHIPELEGVMRRLFQLLSPGGWFYARTPYVAPLKRLFPQFDLTYPGHVHDLGAPFWNRVAETFQLPVRVVISRPSLIETTFARQPVRTTAAWLMKLPARVELALSQSPRTPLWKWVGGWEVVLQKSSAAV